MPRFGRRKRVVVATTPGLTDKAPDAAGAENGENAPVNRAVSKQESSTGKRRTTRSRRVAASTQPSAEADEAKAADAPSLSSGSRSGLRQTRPRRGTAVSKNAAEAAAPALPSNDLPVKRRTRRAVATSQQQQDDTAVTAQVAGTDRRDASISADQTVADGSKAETTSNDDVKRTQSKPKSSKRGSPDSATDTGGSKLPKRRRVQRQPLKKGSAVEALLIQFDNEVEERKNAMRDQVLLQTESLRMVVETELIKMRRQVKTMTMRDFMSATIVSSAIAPRTASRIPAAERIATSPDRVRSSVTPGSTRKPFSQNRFTPLAARLRAPAHGSGDLRSVGAEISTMSSSVAQASSSARADQLRQVAELQAQLDLLTANLKK